MPLTVGQIGLNMVLNAPQFRTQLNGIQGQAKAASDKISGSFKKIGAAIAGALSAAMIKKFGQECIENAAGVQAANSQLEQTFGSLQIQAKSAMKSVADESGILETRLQGVGTSVYAFAKASGMDSAEALKMMKDALTVTADSAAYYDRSLEDTAESLKSFLKGNYANDAALGISCTETTRNTAANKLYGKSFQNLSEAQKQLTLLQMVKDANQLSGALGQAARESDGWENVTGNLRESWKQFQAVLGRPVLQIATKVVKNLSAALAGLTEYAKSAISSLSGLFGVDTSTVSNDLSSAASSAGSVADEASASAEALNSVAAGAEKAKRSIAGFDRLNILSKDDSSKTDVTNSTQTKTPTKTKDSGASSAASLSSAINNMAKSWDLKGKKLVDSIKYAFGNVKSVIKAVGDSWARVWNNGSGQKVLDNIKTLLTNVFGIIGDIAGAFSNAWKKAGLGDSVVQSIIDKWNSLVGLINTIAGSFREVWNNGSGERIWSNILKFIRNCNNATKTLRDKIKEAWEKNGTGKKIWETILGIVEDVTGFLKDMSEIRLDWLKKLNLSPVVEAVEGLGKAFRELLKACGDKLKTVYKNILLPLAKWTIEKIVPTIVNMLAGALKAVADVVNHLSQNDLIGIASGIAAVATAVIAFKAGTLIADGISKVMNAIKAFSAAVTAHPLAAIAAAVTAVVSAVTAYAALKWENSEAKKFCDELDGYAEKLSETAKKISDTLTNTLDTISQKYSENKVIDEYQEKLEKLLSKAELSPTEMSELKTIVTYFTDNVDGFGEVWSKYVKISDDNKISLNGDLKEIQSEIKKTVDEYQRLANESALSELKTESRKQIISAKQTQSAQLEGVKQREKAFEELLRANGKTLKDWENLYSLYKSTGSHQEDVKWLNNTFGNGAIEMYESIQKAKDGYNEATAEVNKLVMTSDDLSDVQKVLNGDYSDAAAVLMAYNAGMLNAEDVQKTQWKSLSNLTKAAKDSGKNTVLGLVTGTNEYKDALIKNSAGLAGSVLSEYDRVLDTHSPSKEMTKRGVWTVQGLINGVSSMRDNLFKTFRTMWTGIKNIFTNGNGFVNIKNAIWKVFKTALNALISGINSLIKGPFEVLNEAFDTVRSFEFMGNKFFGWLPHINAPQIPKLAKGGVVKAPTLAVVGDNAGAGSGDPEIISPLSKLQGMISRSSGEDVLILTQLLNYVKRIYEMFVVFKNNGGNSYQFIAKINGSEIFEEIVRQNELYKNRHGGKSAFT